MYLDNFVGSDGIKRLLVREIKSNTLAHGILLCSEEGMGANYFARLMAADILGAESIGQIERDEHPSLKTVRGEGKSGQIKVDRVREVIEDANFSSLAGEKRVILIEDCDNLNTASANALLKNLEEPKDDIVYILTTSNVQKILATIRSRCAIHTIVAPSDEEVRSYFLGKGSNTSTVDRLLKIYGSNIGKITAVLEDPKRAEILNCALSVFKLIGSNDSYEIAKAIYPYNKNRDGLSALFDDLTSLCEKKLSAKNIEVINLCLQYSAYLTQNANMNLLIENFAVIVAK